MKKGFNWFRELLILAVEQELQFSKIINNELGALPEGNLVISHDDNHYYFSNLTGNRNRGITKNKKLVHQLARRKYLELLKREIKEDLEFVKKAEKFLNKPKRLKNFSAPNRYSRTRGLLDVYRKAGLDMMRITCTDAQYKWAHANYKKNELFPEQLVYETDSGVKVRSKSERDIGNALEAFGIPYRYEAAVSVDVSWMDDVDGLALEKRKTYYPDFLIMLPSGELIIWEHFGRMDLENYRIHNAEKVAALREGGAIQFENFIASYENDLRESGKIEKIINERILPRMI